MAFVRAIMGGPITAPPIDKGTAFEGGTADTLVVFALRLFCLFPPLRSGSGLPSSLPTEAFDDLFPGFEARFKGVRGVNVEWGPGFSVLEEILCMPATTEAAVVALALVRTAGVGPGIAPSCGLRVPVPTEAERETFAAATTVAAAGGKAVPAVRERAIG
jgi:hypothetical protein